jgi:hypothetical protein
MLRVYPPHSAFDFVEDARTGPGASQEPERSPGISIPSAHSPLGYCGRDYGGDYGRDCGSCRPPRQQSSRVSAQSTIGHHALPPRRSRRSRSGAPRDETTIPRPAWSPRPRRPRDARGRPVDLARTIVYKNAARARCEMRDDVMRHVGAVLVLLALSVVAQAQFLPPPVPAPMPMPPNPLTPTITVVPPAPLPAPPPVAAAAPARAAQPAATAAPANSNR